MPNQWTIAAVEEPHNSFLIKACLKALLVLFPFFLCWGIEAKGTEGRSTTTPHPDMLVTADWLSEHLKDPHLVVVHVAAKGKEPYEAGHIPGARLLEWNGFVTSRGKVANELPPLDKLQEMVRGLGIDSKSRIILYDDEMGTPAARAYFTFDSIGLGDRTALLDGHLRKWMAEGRPLSKQAPEFSPSDFTLSSPPHTVKSLQDVLEMVSAGSGSSGKRVALLDARSHPEYTGSQPGKGIERPGHIPGAANVPSVSLIANASNPTLLSVEELQDLYRQAGLMPGEPVVTYCRTGRAGSMAYFVLKYLGYDVSLYDGSFSEWSADPSAPVQTGVECR